MAYKERGNGQGSVTTLKDSKGKKKYQVRVTVGSKFDVEKERVIYTSKSLGVFKTKAEAEAVQRLCLQSIIRVLMTLLIRLLQ